MRSRLLGTAALALLTAACWWAWLAWDRTYQRDPVTGTASGPYEAWQVAGCVLCLVAVTVWAATRLPLWIVVPVVPVAFTAAWSLTASSYDNSGLWPVGALFLLVGMIAGTVVVAATTSVVQRVARQNAASTASRVDSTPV